MVKFGDFSVIRTAIDACFSRFHVVSHITENTVLVSEGTHIATVYDLSTRSAVRSWSFPESSPLSAPVVFDAALSKYVAVQQNSVIVCFEMNEDITDVSRIKLSHSVYCVLGHSKYGTFILFKNGCLQSLNRTKENVVEDSDCLLKSNENIVWSQICYWNDDELIVFLVSEKENVNYFREIFFDTSSEKVTKTSNVLLSRKYDFFSLNEAQKCVVGLDSSGSLVNLRDEGLILKFPSDYKKNVNSIACMSSNKLIVTVKKKSEHDFFKLEIWDLDYKLAISEITLDLVPLTNAISVSESNIFVCCSKGITVIPFDVKNVSLASVLGKAATIPEKDLELDTDVLEISKKVGLSAPQERERLQTLALDIALKSSGSVNTQALMDVLRFPFCEGFAIHNLKTYKYSVEDVVKLLEMLNVTLTEVNKLFIVNWMCVVVDAYFKQLILSSNQAIGTSLSNILKNVDNLCAYCERLQELRHFVEGYGFTDSLTNIPTIELPQHSVGRYCVEIVYF